MLGKLTHYTLKNKTVFLSNSVHKSGFQTKMKEITKLIVNDVGEDYNNLGMQKDFLNINPKALT